MLTLTSLSCFYVKKTLFDGDLVTAVAVVAGSATAAAADQRQLARDVCEWAVVDKTTRHNNNNVDYDNANNDDDGGR